MDKILLDTDIFSEILKQKHEKVAARAEQYHSYFGFYTITTITVLEIIKGFHKVGRENHIARFLSAISGTEVLTQEFMQIWSEQDNRLDVLIQ